MEQLNNLIESDEIRLDFQFSPKQITEMVEGSVLGMTLQPEFVPADKLRVPDDYKRIRNFGEKQLFRKNLIDGITGEWVQSEGPERAAELTERFMELSDRIDQDGAVVFGDLIDRRAFARLVSQYDLIMDSSGSKSLLHSYVNLRSHPEFLSDTHFNGAFIHPLLIALMAHRMGGPVRMVDARGKDAEPLIVRAQDNMLHIDNTPFNDEYKVLVTWERGMAAGPKGQNFVYLPGTNKGFRNSYEGADGHAWSTENGSIFITSQSVDQLFSFQESLRGSRCVVEVQSDKPATALFSAGSLVHHRYRTESGNPRSGLIIAFHSVRDNPGEFIHGGIDHSPSLGLENFLFGYQDNNSES